MHVAVAPPLEAWGSFYVIVGSSAGALTGLQFVVMTLIAQLGPTRNRGESISAFGTPNVVHFCAALLVAAILTVPWGTLRQAGFAVAASGALGVIYSVAVIRRAHRQSEYQPVFEDWLWHTMLPPLAYGTMFVAGALLDWKSADALLVIAAATLLLVFVGIHNAWDTVTYLTAGAGLGERAAAPQARGTGEVLTRPEASGSAPGASATSDVRDRADPLPPSA